MASDAQNNANRENAKKSTGPRTEAGKNKARFNARRHGLTGLIFALSQDDERAYMAMEDGFLVSLKPVGEAERYLVGLIAKGYWRLGAAAADEQNMLSLRHEDFAETTDAPNPEFHAASVRARIALDDDYTNVPLYEGRLRRVIAAHEKRLKELQSDREAAEARALAEAEALLKLAHMENQAIDPKALTEDVGFVFTDPAMNARLTKKLALEKAGFYQRNHWDRSKRWEFASLKVPNPTPATQN